MAHIPDIIKVRVFGSKNCEECIKQTKVFDMNFIDYEFIDADAKENEKISDENNVDKIPHTQAYFEKSKKIITNNIGYVSPFVLMNRINDSLSSSKNNLRIKGVNQGNLGLFKPNNKEVENCTGCKKNAAEKS